MSLDLDEICAIPNPLTSDVEARRYFHQDLPDMALRELWRERERLRIRFAIEEPPHCWILERGRKVRDALAQSRRRSVAVGVAAGRPVEESA